MKTFAYTITDPEGIHARPAGILVKQAAAFKSTIKMSGNGKEADIKRLIAVMGMGIKKDMEVVFTIEGEDEEEAAATLEKFMQDNL
ncbi:MAG: HPr family phosphocarrier protein [Pseudobutyrivibrio sp.]|nr:HPr family phosphocarrier protein [Pseudobutyrivibrio sp.]